VGDAVELGSCVEDVVSLARLRRLLKSGAARSIRVNADLSYAEMASAVGPEGVSAATVYRWETGKRSPHGELALAYLAVLDALVQAGS
jgi:DNA-binding XRE family transcriptional regulator